MRETGAPLGGEMSGHVFFKDRWYGFDDGLYAGARLLELLSSEVDPNKVLNALPQSMSTPELQIEVGEGENHALVARLQSETTFDGAREVITTDGVRVEYADGFGLVRASNTTPVLVLRFEAENQEGLTRIQQELGRAILAVKPDVTLPF
jgi:phosphomannomutase/phosphoglucomutase